MPSTEFLIAAGHTPRSFEEAVDALLDRSTLFVAAWTAQDVDQASRASRNVKSLFDHIISSLMRARDDIKIGHRSQNSQFIGALGAFAATMATPVTAADQASVRNIGQGRGRLPSGCPTVPATLEQTLNKIKHQNESQAPQRQSRQREIALLPLRFHGHDQWRASSLSRLHRGENCSSS